MIKDIHSCFVSWLDMIVVKLVGGVLHLHLFCQLPAAHYICNFLLRWDTHAKLGRIYHDNLITDPHTLNICLKDTVLRLQCQDAIRTENIILVMALLF